MQCNYNSFIQIINFHGFFRNALRCRKNWCLSNTGALMVLLLQPCKWKLRECFGLFRKGSFQCWRVNVRWCDIKCQRIACTNTYKLMLVYPYSYNPSYSHIKDYTISTRWDWICICNAKLTLSSTRCHTVGKFIVSLTRSNKNQRLVERC